MCAYIRIHIYIYIYIHVSMKPLDGRPLTLHGMGWVWVKPLWVYIHIRNKILDF